MNINADIKPKIIVDNFGKFKLISRYRNVKHWNNVTKCQTGYEF